MPDALLLGSSSRNDVMADPLDSVHHYLPVGDDVIHWGTYVTGAGRTIVEPGAAYPDSNHPSLYSFEWKHGRTLPEFQILLVTAGRGVFESEPTGVLPVSDGSGLVIGPDVWHRYRPDASVGWTERWLSFSGEVPYRLLDLDLLDIRRPLFHLGSSALIDEFDALLDRIRKNPVQNSIVLAMHATAWIAGVLEKIRDQQDSVIDRSVQAVSGIADPVVAKAVELIWTQAHRNLSVGHIASQLPVTRRTLDRRFVGVMQHSVLEEIIACRLSRAKRLLVETKLPIRTVTRLSGFSSEERMRVTFQQRLGVSPSEYRESMALRRASSVDEVTTDS